MKQLILNSFLFLLSLNIYSQSFSGIIEFKRESDFILPGNHHKFLNTKGKILISENKEKIIDEDDFFGDGKIRSATHIQDEKSFSTIDSLSKTITKIYSEPKSYLDEFKTVRKSRSDAVIFDQLIKTDSVVMILNIECRKFLFYQKIQDKICKTEYFITDKYGIKFKVPNQIHLNGYGIALKRVLTTYEDGKMKNGGSKTVITVTRVEEMKIDDKEFLLPEGWPVHSVNVSSKLKSIGY